MKVVTIRDAVVAMLQETVYGFVSYLQSFRKQQTTPSLLANNVVWFTNCTWLEQLQAFNQLDGWIDVGKGNYLYK